MLNRAQIEAMTPEARRDNLYAMAKHRYGTDKWRAPLAQEFGWHHKTVSGWGSGKSPVPIHALILLSVVIERDALAERWRNVAAIIEKEA